MNDAMLRDILRRLKRLEDTSARLRIGEVTGIDPLDVALGGASTSYENVKAIVGTPNGTQAAALVSGNDLIVLGPVGSGRTISARVRNSVALVIPDNVSTAVTFDTEEHDEGDLHPAGSSLLTVPTDGLYLAGGGVSWALTSTVGVRVLELFAGGAPVDRQEQNANSATFELQQTAGALARMTTGQSFQMFVYQNSGANLNIQAVPSRSPVFWAVRLGA